MAFLLELQVRSHPEWDLALRWRAKWPVCALFLIKLARYSIELHRMPHGDECSPFHRHQRDDLDELLGSNEF